MKNLIKQRSTILTDIYLHSIINQSRAESGHLVVYVAHEWNSLEEYFQWKHRTLGEKGNDAISSWINGKSLLVSTLISCSISPEKRRDRWPDATKFPRHLDEVDLCARPGALEGPSPGPEATRRAIGRGRERASRDASLVNHREERERSGLLHSAIERYGRVESPAESHLRSTRARSF